MLWIGLFLTSLNDYYVAAICGAPLPVLGLLFLAFHCGRFNQLRWLEKAYVLVITLSFIVGFCRLSTDLAVEVKFANGIGWLIGFGALLIDLQTRQYELQNALRIFLLIHAEITGEPQRYLAETHTLRISVFSIRRQGSFSNRATKLFIYCRSHSSTIRTLGELLQSLVWPSLRLR